MTVLAAGGPLLWLPTASARWRNIPNLSQQMAFIILLYFPEICMNDSSQAFSLNALHHLALRQRAALARRRRHPHQHQRRVRHRPRCQLPISSSTGKKQIGEVVVLLSCTCIRF